VAQEYQIDSNLRWRTCGSTASRPFTCNSHGLGSSPRRQPCLPGRADELTRAGQGKPRKTQDEAHGFRLACLRIPGVRLMLRLTGWLSSPSPSPLPLAPPLCLLIPRPPSVPGELRESLLQRSERTANEQQPGVAVSTHELQTSKSPPSPPPIHCVRVCVCTGVCVCVCLLVLVSCGGTHQAPRSCPRPACQQ
jgi:hypothetical protein